jgi:hypothetical protein
VEHGQQPATPPERTGFETTIDIASTAAFVAVQALDAGGAILGASAVVQVGA